MPLPAERKRGEVRAREREGGRRRENRKRGDSREDLGLMCSVHSVCKSVVLLLIVKASPALPRWLSSKESICQSRDVGSIPGSQRSPGGGNGNPLQYSCLENPMDRGTWRATVHGIAESEMTERLNNKPRIAYGVECA